MSALTIEITPQQAEFIDRAVGEGQFVDAAEAIRAAIRLLQADNEVKQLKLIHLRRLLQESTDAFDRGEFETIANAGDLDRFIHSASGNARRAGE